MARQKRRIRQSGILDVAARAGVSPATVSRYFNHPDLVRYETRNRIAQIAAELGYVRNRAAGSLNRGRSGAIGLVVPTVDNAIFAELIQEFASALNGFEHALLISAHGYDLSEEALQVQTLLEHQVDGVVLVGAEHTEETFRLIEANDIAALTVWNWHRQPRIPCIGVDNRELGRLAALHLYDFGHRDIACFFPAATGNDRAVDRRNAAFAALARRGASIPQARRIVCPYDIGIAKGIVQSTLSAPDRPSAILAGNDIIAQAAIYAALCADLRVPEEVSIIGIGDFRSSAALEPSLTTIRIPARQIAVHAAETIVDMINDARGSDERSLRVEPELLVRASTGPAPAPA